MRKNIWLSGAVMIGIFVCVGAWITRGGSSSNGRPDTSTTIPSRTEQIAKSNLRMSIALSSSLSHVIFGTLLTISADLMFGALGVLKCWTEHSERQRNGRRLS